jgi:benzil reductase ((S)-benzoin forming)
MESQVNLVFITGGSRGIGKALAAHYAAAGWTVVEFSRSGSGPQHVAIDLADVPGAIRAAAREFQSYALQPWERVVLVNNAGLLTPVAPVRALDEEAITRSLSVNLAAGIGLIAAFARCFAGSNAGKVVVNVSSGAALKGYFGWSLYCASKAGMENFIRSLAAEQAAEAHPLTCINFAPGMVDTAMQEEIRGTAPENFPDVGRFIQTKEAGELRTPEAVARTIARIVDEGATNGERYTAMDYD